MTDELPDLEPIDITQEAPATAADTWSPGWYADPWTAGQYRYWSGQAWTGETNRWGPANAAARATAGTTDPWPQMSTPMSTPMSSGYGPQFPGGGAGIGTAPGEPQVRRRRGPMIAGVTALAVVVLLSGAIGYAIDSRSHSSKSPSAAAPFVPGPFIASPSTPGGSATTTPTTIPPGAISHDPDRHALANIVVRQADVAPSHMVLLIPSGNQLNEPTLDLCNGTYPSERLRTARLQVADVDSSVNPSLSTEAVLYRNTAASVQAFAELRKVSASCPHRPVASPVGEGTSQTTFKPAPDASWPHTASVERQAYSFTSTTPATANTPAATTPSVAVYLRRGRALLGLYFSDPSGAQSEVAGQRTIAGIVGVFEARMAALPAAVVNAG